MQIYVGPYLRCLNDYVNVTSMKKTCANPNCNQYKTSIWITTAKFCQTCGSPIKKRALTEKSSPNLNRHHRLSKISWSKFIVLGPKNGCMEETEETYFIPYNPPLNSYLVQYSIDEDPIPLESVDIEKQKNVFLQHYAKELVVLKEVYEEVQIKYGVVTYEI